MKTRLKKAQWFTVTTILCLVVTLFVAGSCDKSDILPNYYTLSFVGEGVGIEPQSIAHGDHATVPENPEREGYSFIGWFTDNGTFSNEWDFETNIVTQDITLYAKWKENTLQGTKWKLIGIVDVQTGKLTELEPTDCDECYTLIFETNKTLSGRMVNNVILALFSSYEINYTDGTLQFYIISTAISNTEDEHLYSQIIWRTQSFTINDSHPKILHLYSDDDKNYLKFKEIGGSNE